MPRYYYDTAIGPIGIEEDNGSLTHLYFAADPTAPDCEVRETPLLKEAAGQLAGYLAGERKEFSLPLVPTGTAFRRQVWAQLGQVPYGQTASYGAIAEQMGRPTAARAVGQAANHNPLPIFIPCHRIIGAAGTLTGYRGGIALKKRLLGIEQSR